MTSDGVSNTELMMHVVRVVVHYLRQGCPDLAGSRPKNLDPKTTKGPNSKIFKFNHSLDSAYCILLKFASKIN